MRRLLLVGGLVFVLALLLNLPARTVAGWIGIEDVVAMQGITGTVWSGGASAASVATGTPAEDDDLYLGAVRWRFNPMSVALGRLEYAIAAEGGPSLAGVRGNISPAGDNAVRLIDTTGRARLDAVAPLLSIPMLTGISGTVDFELANVVIEGSNAGAGWPRQANGRLVLRNVAVSLLPGSLGDYEIIFRDEEGSDNVLVEYRDLENGPLGIRGTATLRPDGTFERTCTAEARSGAPPMLVQAVPMICSENLF